MGRDARDIGYILCVVVVAAVAIVAIQCYAVYSRGCPSADKWCMRVYMQYVSVKAIVARKRHQRARSAAGLEIRDLTKCDA